MRKITIEIPEQGDAHRMFDVVDEQGRRCDGLCFGEMLEQLIVFCAEAIQIRGRRGYKMATPEECEQWKRSLGEK